MSYKILAAHIEYSNKVLSKVTVVVDINEDLSDVRCIYATNAPRSGYIHLKTSDNINEALLQKVAGYGCATSFEESKFPEFFPNKNYPK